MPKLLQLNVTANWGSTGKIAEGIGLSAMERGWKSAIAFGRMQNSSKSQLIKVGSQYDVYLHFAHHRIFDGEGLASVNPTKKLIGRIEQFAPDVVHLHNIHDHWINYPLLMNYLRESKVKVVWTFHDCWAFTGGCPHFVEIGCDQWKTECCVCRHPRAIVDRTKRNFNKKQNLTKALGANLTIVSVSRWLDSLVGESGFNEIDHRVIYNGIDTTTFAPGDTKGVDVKYSLKGKCVLMGVSNIWTESKGLSDYARLRRQLSDEYIIVLVGLSAKQIKSLPTGILGIPRTDSIDELAALYSRADAVLCLSKAETFGLTLVEGLACGTPSVGYADTAIKELLSPEIGIPVEPGNITELVGALRIIGQKAKVFDPNLCRQYVLDNFDQKQQYNKYIDLYESILGHENKLEV